MIIKKNSFEKKAEINFELLKTKQKKIRSSILKNKKKNKRLQTPLEDSDHNEYLNFFGYKYRFYYKQRY